MKFKTEISLLLGAIILYIASAFCYSFEASSQGWLPYQNYPYRHLAIPLAIVASVILIIAAILYSKRSKSL